MKRLCYYAISTFIRGVPRGGTRGAKAPTRPGIWQFSEPYSNNGGQIMPLTLLPAPPRFKKLSTPLSVYGQNSAHILKAFDHRLLDQKIENKPPLHFSMSPKLKPEMNNEFFKYYVRKILIRKVAEVI